MFVLLSGDVTTKMCKYLERCLTQGPLTLVLLSKVETKLCEDYEFSDFRDLGHGSFLDLLTQGELKKVRGYGNCSECL